MKEICASSSSGKRWLLRTCEDIQALAFSQKLGVSSLLARLLSMRGHDLTSAPLFLQPSLRTHLPDPLILKDMVRAIERVLRAITEKESIVVWGDYDVDGATSSALLCRFFKAIGVPVLIYIPDRLKEGYGPNGAALQKLKNQGHSLIITVDCGTTSFDAFTQAKDLDVIVLDHHTPETKLPPAYAIVNPNRLDETPEATASLGHLAAVGLSFLFVVGLNRALRKLGFYEHTKEPDLMAFLDLVALGTVCDVMPLTGLNRTFVAQGLKVMGARKNVGLRVLADYAGLEEAPSPYHLGFILGPRINAGGRVGEASLGAKLLSTDTLEEAQAIAQKLEHYNQERRALETLAFEQAILQVNPKAPVIVVDREEWHEGVIGIVAGRLKERFHKPTAVIAWTKTGIGKGSARSIPGFDFGRFIHKAHHLGYLLGGGGHAMAAGFSLTKDQLVPFQQLLEEELARSSSALQDVPTVLCDGYLDLRALTPALLHDLEGFSPFGLGNPAPKFIFSDVMVRSYTLIQDQHIKCRFSQGDGMSVEGIGFRIKGTPLGEALMEGQKRPLHLVASPKLDTWGGKTKVTLMLEDTATALC